MWCWLHRHRHRRESKCWEPNHRQLEYRLREMIGNCWLLILVGNFPTVPNVRLFLRWSPWWLLRGSWQQTQRRPSKSIPTFSPYSWCLRDEWNYNKRLVTGLTVTIYTTSITSSDNIKRFSPASANIYSLTYHILRNTYIVKCVYVRACLAISKYLFKINRIRIYFETSVAAAGWMCWSPPGNAIWWWTLYI